jgi:hypothetical protein
MISFVAGLLEPAQALEDCIGETEDYPSHTLRTGLWVWATWYCGRLWCSISVRVPGGFCAELGSGRAEGLSGSDTRSNFGFMCPTMTPAEIIRSLHAFLSIGPSVCFGKGRRSGDTQAHSASPSGSSSASHTHALVPVLVFALDPHLPLPPPYAS